MSNDAEGLRALIKRWYEHEDDVACRDLVERLSGAMPSHPDVSSKLGKGRVEELKQETLVHLLERQAKRMQNVERPTLFARKAFKNRLLSELRTHKRRREIFDTYRDIEINKDLFYTSDDIQRVDFKMDTKRAMELAQRLSYNQRVLLMLLLMPSTITPEDWVQLCEKHPPPPPLRPFAPVDEEEARHLLMPMNESSDIALQRQRDRFRVTRRRAVDALRSMLEEEE